MPPIDGFPVPVTGPKITPGSTSPGPPQHAVDDQPVIHPPAATPRRPIRQQRLQPRPFLIGQIMTIKHDKVLPPHPLKIRETRPSPAGTHRAPPDRRCAPTKQASCHPPDRLVAPPYTAFDAGLRPGPFPDQTASLLPGLLAATRTGLPPAGDDELTNSKIRCYVTASPPALLGARKARARRTALRSFSDLWPGEAHHLGRRVRGDAVGRPCLAPCLLRLGRREPQHPVRALARIDHVR